jgi:hypothetical protein
MIQKRSAFCCAAALFALTLGACATEESPAESDTTRVGQEVRIGDYYNPPRCGPRNCVAMCVTCEYDLCRISGSSASECDAESEFCIDACNQGQECQPGAPCDCGSGDPTHC